MSESEPEVETDLTPDPDEWGPDETPYDNHDGPQDPGDEDES